MMPEPPLVQRFWLRPDSRLLTRLFGVPISRCYVDVTPTTLHIVVGWCFNQVIRRQEIAWVGHTSHGWASGIGERRISFFAFTRRPVTEIRLQKPRRMRVFVLFPTVEWIALAFATPIEFEAAVCEPDGRDRVEDTQPR